MDAAISTFHNGMINGDSSSDVNAFDGLDKFLVGTTTEFGTDEYIDLSTIALLKSNADVFYEALLTLINRTGILSCKYSRLCYWVYKSKVLLEE